MGFGNRPEFFSLDFTMYVLFSDFVFTYLDLDFQKYVKHDSQFFRASELIPLCGNSAKAQEHLGWHNMTPFKEMVKNMIDVELDQYNKTR